MHREQTTIRLPGELKEQLQKEAERRGDKQMKLQKYIPIFAVKNTVGTQSLPVAAFYG